jgi:Phosphodiester glycosidase
VPPVPTAPASSTPAGQNTVEAVLTPFPAVAPNADLGGTVVEVAQGGGRPIPPGGAVLVARGTQAERLAAEAPVGGTVTVRLLAASLAGVAHAIGGGPLLVRNGRPVYRSGDDFSTGELALWQARSAVGQRADGRLLLVAVDGRQPGYSAGMTNFELALTMVRLGAVTAGGLTIGAATALAHDGKLLSRPPGGERAVADALLVWYVGSKRPPGR